MANNPGPGVDAFGQPVVDPTENVKALTEASVKRIDDIAQLRAYYDERLANQRIRCDDRLDRQRNRYEKELRTSDKELRKAESDRIDAIRAVDVGAVQRAAEVSAAQAEALRNTVAAAAAAAATALGAALDPIQKDIADLRRAQYEAQGKTTQVGETRGAATLTIAIISAVAAVIVAVVVVVGFVIANNP
jgi:cobalamin biosynthesis Mg chelatase CobN